MTDTEIQATGQSGNAFRVGGLLGQTFQVMFANIVPFGLFALALTVLEGLLYWGVLDLPPWNVQGLGGRSQAELLAQSGGMLIMIGVSNLLVSVILSAVLTAILIYGTVTYLRGQQTTIGAYLTNSGRVIVPVVVVSLIAGILAGLGSILLIVPGVFLFVIWWVAIPAVVVERAGIGGSLKRSSELSRGNRWRVLGVIVILILISIALTYPLQTFGRSISATFGSATLLVAAVVAVTFTRMLYAVATGVGYYQLRVAKEGADIEQIAAVFD